MSEQTKKWMPVILRTKNLELLKKFSNYNKTLFENVLIEYTQYKRIYFNVLYENKEIFNFTQYNIICLWYLVQTETDARVAA